MKRIFPFLLLLLASCDCTQPVRGTVLDEGTKQPLRGAIVLKKGAPEFRAYTDSLGRFELTAIVRGFPLCPPMRVVVKASGYLKAEKRIPAGRERIILCKTGLD